MSVMAVVAAANSETLESVVVVVVVTGVVLATPGTKLMQTSLPKSPERRQARPAVRGALSTLRDTIPLGEIVRYEPSTLRDMIPLGETARYRIAHRMDSFHNRKLEICLMR